MSLFSKNRDEKLEYEDEVEREPPRRSFVPASALAPERKRLGIFDSSEEDDREDLDFLTAVAREAERAAATVREPLGAPASVGTVRLDDHRMKVFEEMAPVVERNPVMRTVVIPDIELGELLDELATTASALRLRRAA